MSSNFLSGPPVNISHHRTILQVNYFPTDICTHPQLPKSVCVILQITFPNPDTIGGLVQCWELSLRIPASYLRQSDTDFTEGRTMSSCLLLLLYPHSSKKRSLGINCGPISSQSINRLHLWRQTSFISVNSWHLDACEHWECKVNEWPWWGGRGWEGWRLTANWITFAPCSTQRR